MTLGLDFGSDLGWALGHAGLVASGVVNVRAAKTEPRALRYVYFREFVEGLMVNPSNPALVTRVVYEMPFIRRTATRTLMIGFATRVHELCAIHGARYYEVHALTLKKYATGYGRAEKSHMVRLAKERWPDQTIADDNQADALWLLAYGEAGLADTAQKAKFEKYVTLKRDRRDEKRRREVLERVDAATSSIALDDECAHDWNHEGVCLLCGENPEEEE